MKTTKGEFKVDWDNIEEVNVHSNHLNDAANDSFKLMYQETPPQPSWFVGTQKEFERITNSIGGYDNEPNQLAWQILGWTIIVALVGAAIWHAFKVAL